MFRRRWSGLPDDPDFPTDMESLGYFVNEEDQIRSIADPKYYFDYFISRDTRTNDRQRFSFNNAVVDMIHKRLEAQDLVKLRLPLNTPPTKPHVPIFITANNLPTKRRVVVLFGESTQDLGILAHRAVGGQDGVNEGSMVSIVQRILDDDTDAGIILANTGENWWWPEGQRALCYRQSLGVRMKSAVHKGRAFDPAANGIPKNGDVKAHVKCVFESVLGNGEFLGREARIDVLAMTDAANEVEKYLDANWGRWESHIGCLAMLGGGENPDAIRDEGFKTFLKEKARMYITGNEPAGTPIANPGGNSRTILYTSYGCPVLASGEPFHSELLLIKAKDDVLPWMVKAGEKGYVNPIMEVMFQDETYTEDSSHWEGTNTLWTPGEAALLSALVHKQAGGRDDGQEKADKDSHALEIVSKEEWESRKETAEDEGVKLDEGKIFVV